MRFSSVFTGGGGADIGARDAGFELGDGLEIDSDIAKVANDNLGGHVHIGDILTTDPSLFKPMDLLHASTPCPSFSVANNKKGETELDIALAEKVCEFIRYHKPKLFTLENVMGYRKSKSCALIISTLAELGYMYDAQILNSADFGVPQTRRRLIVRASRIGMIPALPDPVKWVGWYEAIEDLIPTLPESKFADWQLKKLKLLKTTVLVNESSTMEIRVEDQPAATQIATGRGGGLGQRVFENGRVVSMTPRALARFQSIPDWYQLSEKKLACKIIGNSVPPLMYQRIAEGLLETL